MRPDIHVLLATLRREKSAYVPLMELGVHPKLKEQLLGRPLSDLKDEVEFWYKAGYDYVKLQPQVQFNLGALLRIPLFNPNWTVLWAMPGPMKDRVW